MKKPWIVTVLMACLLVLALAPAAAAVDTSVLDRNIASGTCGEGISWSLDGYTLTITGSGEITEAPWLEHKNHIEKILISGGVTKICDEAFSGCDRVEEVDFGSDLVEIGTRAFYACKDLPYVHVPATFRKFGKEAFRGCDELKYVYCDGGMPRFEDSCLWTGNYIAVFYPTNNPWAYEYYSPLVNSYGGNLGIMMGNFDASAVAANLAQLEAEKNGETVAQTEPAQTKAATEPATEPAAPVAATQPATVPTTPPVTQPATVPTTAPTTAPTTQPTTQPETEPLTEPTQATGIVLETTEQPQPEVVEQVGGKGWIAVVLIAGVLTFLLVGALIFRAGSHKGGKYS